MSDNDSGGSDQAGDSEARPSCSIRPNSHRATAWPPPR